MGEKLTALLLNPLHAQTSSVGRCIAVLYNDLFLPWMFVTHCLVKFLECLKVTSGTDGFPLWQTLDHHASFIIPKKILAVVLCSEGIVFGFFCGEGSVM
jgi:hypothetical protein